MKKTFRLLALSFVGMLALNSCKKVTPGKLAGDWTVASGTYDYSDKNGTYTYSSKTNFNGTKETGSSSRQVCAACTTIVSDVNNDKTIKYSFDKKAGTFTRVTKNTQRISDLDFATVYIPSTTSSTKYDVLPGVKVDRITDEVSTFTESGIYEITGGSGDIKKNSEIVLRVNDDSRTVVRTITYYQGTVLVDPNGKYVVTGYGGSSGTTWGLIPTSETSTVTNKGLPAAGEIWTVDELKRKKMTIKFSDENTNVSGAVTTTRSSKGTFELEQD